MTYPDFACSWLFPAIYQGIKIVKKYDIQVILATGMPWTALIIAYFIKLFTGKKLIIDFRDPWVGNPYIEKSKFEHYLDRKVESKIIRSSHVVIANTHHLKQEISDRYPTTTNKLVVVPNGFKESGSPTSISFLGRLFEEGTLLAVAAAYQEATDFHRQRPEMFNK